MQEIPYDLDDKRSLANIVPPWLRAAMEEVPRDMYFWSEEKLRGYARADAKLNRIRLAFWAEYEEAQSELRMFNLYGITKRVGMAQSYIKELLSDVKVLPYVLLPPVTYDLFLEEALSHGLSRLREILDIQIVDEDGKLDHKSAEILLKATAFIDMRKNGGIVQRTMNVHAFSGSAGEKRFANQLSSGELDKKIKELEGKREYIEARRSIGQIDAPKVELVNSNELVAEYVRVGAVDEP